MSAPTLPAPDLAGIDYPAFRRYVAEHLSRRNEDPAAWLRLCAPGIAARTLIVLRDIDRDLVEQLTERETRFLAQHDILTGAGRADDAEDLRSEHQHWCNKRRRFRTVLKNKIADLAGIAAEHAPSPHHAALTALIRAVLDHQGRLAADDASDADLDLWDALDRITVDGTPLRLLH